MTRLSRTAVSALALILVLASTPYIRGADKQAGLIVTCARPCAAVVALVTDAGGSVTQRYDNVDAVAVSVPASRVADLAAAFGAGTVRKDVIVAQPRPEAQQADAAMNVQTVDPSVIADQTAALPANYNYNNALTGAATLHATGKIGTGVVVAVIDTGVAVAAAELAGTVIGGENFVPGDVPATSRLNDWHGTGVGAMIAAHANFLFANTSRLVQSLMINAPQSVIACTAGIFICPATQSVVPMFGTAPGAKIYALKVFPRQGGGAPESRIIAAMDRAITLRRNFNNGGSTLPVAGDGTENNPFQYNALNIRVANMSLGGPTLNAGADIEDQLTVAMINTGITVAVAAGNDGFAAMTGGGPGTGIGALTVGASNTPVHERVLRDNQFGVGIGSLYRPFNGVQTSYFSSRGPTADGRFDPDMSANGFASYVAAFAAIAGGQIISCGHPAAPPSGPNACTLRILFVSGTSFATPTTAGAAALLRGAAPTATALQVRNAIALGANPAIVTDGSGRIDQGTGFLDVPAALALLEGGQVSNEFPKNGRKDDVDDEPDDVGAGGKSVQNNLRALGIDAVKFHQEHFSASTGTLLPGQVKQFYLPSDLFTRSFTVTISNIVRGGSQNMLFGDDLFVMAVDAPTSFAVHRFGDGGDFVGGDTTFAIDNPQTGLLRLAIQGDWTNASPITATVTIDRARDPGRPHTAGGSIRQDDLIPYTVNVPAGKTEAAFELFWMQNWGRYPTNDLDMIVIDPSGNLVVGADGNPPGATLNSPERVVVANPAAATWRIFVSGFAIQRNVDVFAVTASADGQRLKIAK
jgi:hypothetical protein